MEWILWEDSTCLDVSQCLLNKTILQLAGKYLHSDSSLCIAQFLQLGIKASTWSGKHIQMTFMSREDSQEEEHNNIFFQLLLDNLGFSAAIFSAMIKDPVKDDQTSMIVVGKFITHQLDLVKQAMLEIKSINSIASETLKAAQEMIRAAVLLCTEYSILVNWELHEAGLKSDESEDWGKDYIRCHVVDMIAVTSEKLFELGILAANAGGSLVTILNVSLKGVVSLLQLGKGNLASRVKIVDIIVSLISLIIESLKCAAEAWSSSPKDAISVTEARRIFVPVKFYMINVIKICSLYPCRACMVYKNIALCILIISAFKLSMSHQKLLRSACEVMVELLEKSSLDLVNTLLKSISIKQELKHEILDWLFTDTKSPDLVSEHLNCSFDVIGMVSIFSISPEAMSRAQELMIARVSFFVDILKYSFDLGEDVRAIITRKLNWVLNALIDEQVYPFILVSEAPMLYTSGETVEIVWESMFTSVLHSLKTFMIVASSSLDWTDVEIFLLGNLFHPHFLCSEVVTELSCFLVHHAETEFVKAMINKLIELMNLVASTESVLFPSSLRKIARLICVLVFGAPLLVEQVFCSVTGETNSQVSSVLYLVLLSEGFPLNLLSENMRSIAKQKLITDYFGFIDKLGDKAHEFSSSVFGLPVFALSASLHSQQVSISDVAMKTLKLLSAIINFYKSSTTKHNSVILLKCLRESLHILSKMGHVFASEEMAAIVFQIQQLFVSGLFDRDNELYQCIPELALFMAETCGMGMLESDSCAKSCAVWELYHMLLRERHWAFVYLALKSFGYFAARTSCNQLWRFVPHDAALSFDLESGTNATEERFMSEFKVFLEKEMALLTLEPSSEQLVLLTEECSILKKVTDKIQNLNLEADRCDILEVDGRSKSRKRKLPDEIEEGVRILQNGLKVMKDGFSQWQQSEMDSTELHSKFLTQFCCLEDIIAHLDDLSEYEVRVINGFTNNSSMPLVIWCSSEDSDLGGRALQEGDDFGWRLKTKLWGSTRYLCTMKWDATRRHFDAFKVPRDSQRCAPFKKCSWLVKEDGFYFSSDEINWRKDFSWL